MSGSGSEAWRCLEARSSSKKHEQDNEFVKVAPLETTSSEASGVPTMFAPPDDVLERDNEVTVVQGSRNCRCSRHTRPSRVTACSGHGVGMPTRRRE
jgi:hypothetical protein